MWHATILDFIYAKTAKLYKVVRPLKAWVKKVVKSKVVAKKWQQTFKAY